MVDMKRYSVRQDGPRVGVSVPMAESCLKQGKKAGHSVVSVPESFLFFFMNCGIITVVVRLYCLFI